MFKCAYKQRRTKQVWEPCTPNARNEKLNFLIFTKEMVLIGYGEEKSYGWRATLLIKREKGCKPLRKKTAASNREKQRSISSS